MHLVPFLVVDSDLAVLETRVATLFEESEGVPAGEYGLIEFFCPDAACDCRRVLINVVEKERPTEYLASISYGFDRDGEDAGPYLDPLNRQCAYAETLLRLVGRVALGDADYLARLERHYAVVKSAATDSQHPAYAKLQKACEGDWLTSFGVPPRRKRIGRNVPCPCGSGKKYKRCCGAGALRH